VYARRHLTHSSVLRRSCLLQHNASVLIYITIQQTLRTIEELLWTQVYRYDTCINPNLRVGKCAGYLEPWTLTEHQSDLVFDSFVKQATPQVYELDPHPEIGKTKRWESPAVTREDVLWLYSSCCSTDLQGHPRRSKINNFYVSWKICDFLLVINSNLDPISHRLAAIHLWLTDRRTNTQQPVHTRSWSMSTVSS